MTSRLPRGVTARDGRYQLTIDTGTDPLTGKRRRASITFDALADYEVVRARLVLEHHGKRPSAKTLTFGELLERWFAMVRGDLGPRTADGYRAIIDNYAHGRPSPGRHQGKRRAGFSNPIGTLPLHQVTTERLDAFYMRLRTEGGVDGTPLTAATCRRIHALFGPALALAAREGLIAENPTGVFLGKRAKARTRKLPPLAHVWAIISECNPDTVDAAMLGLCIGGREGELAGIRWDDVDLDAATISIVRAVVVRADRSVEIVNDDGRKSEARTFALPRAAIGALTRRRAACAQDALLCGVPLEDCYVLGEIPGLPLSPDTIGSRWRRAEKRAGVKFRFHDLRHYHTSLLLDAGVPTPTIVSQLGWTSPQMIGTYGHTVRELDTRAAAVIDGTVGDRFSAARE